MLSSERLKELPDTPTMAEGGLKDFVVMSWNDAAFLQNKLGKHDSVARNQFSSQQRIKLFFRDVLPPVFCYVPALRFFHTTPFNY